MAAAHDRTASVNPLSFNERSAHALERARRESSQVAVLFLDLDHFNLETAVERARWCVWAGGWREATTQRIGTRKEERQSQAPARTCQRTRSGLTQLVRVIEGTSVSIHEAASREIERSTAVSRFKHINDSLGHPLGDALLQAVAKRLKQHLREEDTVVRKLLESFTAPFPVRGHDLTQLAAERLHLEGELHEAISRDQLVAYYQSQHALADGRLVGAETLLRWRHPELGLVPPERFIQHKAVTFAAASGEVSRRAMKTGPLSGPWVVRRTRGGRATDPPIARAGRVPGIAE